MASGRLQGTVIALMIATFRFDGKKLHVSGQIITRYNEVDVNYEVYLI